MSLLGLRAGAEDPPLGLIDAHIVDAGLPPPHVPVVVELPQFVAIAAIPLTRCVAALVLEATAIRRPPNDHRSFRSP